jgi:thiamine biosynthesis protein ThiS
MGDTLTLEINGQPRSFTPAPEDLSALLQLLALQSDRVAVEHNGQIVPRSAWASAAIANGDKLEIVHFVGGGC